MAFFAGPANEQHKYTGEDYAESDEAAPDADFSEGRGQGHFPAAEDLDEDVTEHGQPAERQDDDAGGESFGASRDFAGSGCGLSCVAFRFGCKFFLGRLSQNYGLFL